MDASRWQHIRTLFDALIEHPASTWEDALKQRVPDDAELRQEVLALLRADVEAGDAPSCLADRAPDLLRDLADEEAGRQADRWVGRQLGPWRIVRPLGRGGMGMVYLGGREDGGFQQQVAIKLLRLDLADAVAHQRFLSERQILAELQHPHIARLLDGGSSPDSGPWFALEYVDGVTLTAWCDAHRLGIRERLQLFLDVCAAVSYAHERLIVHRDLKPANILVDAAGQAKLLDFGIAKLLDAGVEHTGTATRAFTPDYAAPEQVRGERATTATDVYALGVILYELLTGRRPYRIVDRTPLAIERAVLTQDPLRPSAVAMQYEPGAAEPGPHPEALARNRGSGPAQLRARLRGDLDAIVLKALRKEAPSRYDSVRELAQDLRNALALRPVQARRGGWRYHADRFLRRNALAVTVSGLAFAGLALGLVAALTQAREARLQRDAAEREATTSKAALSFMQGMFQIADPVRAEGRQVTARELLDQGSRRIRRELREEPQARAALLVAMADAYRSLGFDAEALSLLDTFAPDDAALLPQDLRDRIAFARAAALLGLGEHRRVADELQAMRAADPGPGNALRDATFEHYLGRAFHAGGDEARAETAYRKALAAREGLLGFDHALTQETVAALIGLLERFGRHDEAGALAERSVAAFAGRDTSHDVTYAKAVSALAMVRTNTGRLDEAERLRRQALVIFRNIYGDDHTETVGAINDLASVLFSQRRYADVLPVFREVFDARKRLYGERHPSVANAANNLALALLQTGDAQQALDLAIQATAIRTEALGPRHGSTAQSIAVVGSASLALGRLDDAERALKEALDISDEVFGMDNTQPPALLNNLARIALQRPQPPADCGYSARALKQIQARTSAQDLRHLYTRVIHLACERRRGAAGLDAELDGLLRDYAAAARPDDPYTAILEQIVHGP